MYIGLRVKCPLFLSDFNGIWTFPNDFRKILNTKCHENPSSGKSVVPCGETQTDGQTDVTKLIVTSRNSASVPKNQNTYSKFSMPLTPFVKKILNLHGFRRIKKKTNAIVIFSQFLTCQRKHIGEIHKKLNNRHSPKTDHYCQGDK